MVTPDSWDTIRWWQGGRTPQEIIHHRLRRGSSQRGNTRFVTETVNRARRAGATGPITVRADKGFWSRETVQKPERMGVEWFIAIPRYPDVKQAIENIDDTDWVDIGYTTDGVAQVADTTATTVINKKARTLRLIIRRTRLTDRKQQQLWPDWRHHTFATNSNDLPVVEADRMYRNHACVEPGCPRFETSHRTGPLPIGQVLRQRRPDGRRGDRPQPLPVDQPPQRRTTGTAHQRSHRPQPPVQTARKDRQPQPQTHPPPTHQLAMVTHLPLKPHSTTSAPCHNSAEHPPPTGKHPKMLKPEPHHPGCRIPQLFPTPSTPRSHTRKPQNPAPKNKPHPPNQPKTALTTPTNNKTVSDSG